MSVYVGPGYALKRTEVPWQTAFALVTAGSGHLPSRSRRVADLRWSG